MPRTVLIVDDHAAFRRRARELLEDDGFEVVGEAADGESAVEAAQPSAARGRPARRAAAGDRRVRGRPSGSPRGARSARGRADLQPRREHLPPSPAGQPGARVHRQGGAVGRVSGVAARLSFSSGALAALAAPRSSRAWPLSARRLRPGRGGRGSARGLGAAGRRDRGVGAARAPPGPLRRCCRGRGVVRGRCRVALLYAHRGPLVHLLLAYPVAAPAIARRGRAGRGRVRRRASARASRGPTWPTIVLLQR